MKYSKLPKMYSKTFWVSCRFKKSKFFSFYSFEKMCKISIFFKFEATWKILLFEIKLPHHFIDPYFKCFGYWLDIERFITEKAKRPDLMNVFGRKRRTYMYAFNSKFEITRLCYCVITSLINLPFQFANPSFAFSWKLAMLLCLCLKIKMKLTTLLFS